MLSQLRFRRHRERAYTWLIALGGVLLAVGAAWLARDYALRMADDGFRREVSARSAALETVVARQRQVVRSLGAFLATREKVSDEEFERYVRAMMDDVPGMQALMWMPRVANADRAAFEKSAQATLGGYRIVEPVDDWNQAPAGARDDYYPVRYVTPLDGNQGLVGLDMASEPLRADALMRARKSNDVAASDRIVLMDDEGVHYGLLVVTPVLTGDGTLLGYAGAMLRVGEFLQTAISRLPPVGLQIAVTDASGPGAERTLHVFSDRLQQVSDLLSVPFGPQQDATADQLFASYDLPMADRLWRVYIQPGVGYYAPLPPMPAWVAAVFVLLVTAMLIALLLLMQKRAQMLARQSLSDGLTGLANRTFCERMLAAEWDRAVRYEKPLSIIMVDIDRFADFNARFGPLAGDDCLRRVAQALEHVPARSSDLVCRYAGDRFLVILPETVYEGAHTLARRLVEAIRALGIGHPGRPTDVLTISAVASYMQPQRGDLLDTFIARAAEQLDSAERSEGNCVLGVSVVKH
jgi:diguanylate cyclase (GGDEF)-like protein